MKDWSERYRADFPALNPRRGRAPIYLDSACMSLAPRAVVQAMEEYYTDFPGCGGRSVHRWSSRVTDAVESFREGCGAFFGGSPEEFVNLRNTTEALNLVAKGLDLRRGDRVLLTDQEHNSNLVVWQELAERIGIRIEFLPLPEETPFDPEGFAHALSRGVRVVSFFHSSNLDGRTLPAREIVERAHDAGALVLLDGSQSAPHHRLDLDRLGADFYALSLHKMLGPSGTGLLYLRSGGETQVRPLVSGGETVAWSDYRGHEKLEGPARYEAGLQNYAGIVGARAALAYLERVDFAALSVHEARLQRLLDRELDGIPLRHVGAQNAADRGSIYSFALSHADSHDVALFLDAAYQVMVRSGMNCVHSWYRARNLEGSVRASFYLYTSESDVMALARGIRELSERLTPSQEGRSTAPSPSLRRSPDRPVKPSRGRIGPSSLRARPRSRAGRSSR